MLDKLYITPRQWMRILRWSLYFLLVVAVMMLQTVLIGNRLIFGVKLDLIPLVLFCVCLREGPDRGGVFCLLSSLFLALSGADQGALLIFLLTVLPVLASLLMRKIFVMHFLSTLVTCGVLLLLTQSVCFVFRLMNGATAGSLYFTRLLPMVVVSLLFQPVIYWLVKSIGKIGDPYETA